jgi:hypothetical protein
LTWPYQDADEAQNLTPEMREKIMKDKLILVYFEEGDPESEFLLCHPLSRSDG